jgi:hypothetical protein
MKSAFIGLSAAVLIFANIIPAALLIPMSGLQLITAIIGSGIAFGIHKIRYK